MHYMVIFAAVLLSAQAATVPPVIVHQVSVPLPSNVLAPPSEVEPVEVPAVVVEVSKNHKHNPDMPVKLMEMSVTTVQPEQAAVETTVQPEISTDVLTTVQPEISADVETTVQPEVSVDEVTTVQAMVEDVVREDAHVEGSGLLPAVTILEPLLKEELLVQPADEVTTNPTLEEDTTNVDSVTEGINLNVVTTLVPLIDDIVTKGVLDEAVTTLEPDSEDVQTTGVISEELLTTLKPSLVEEDNSQEKSLENSKENSSEESSSSSSESPKAEELPAILSPPHIKDETTVPHITAIPPITADADSESSSEEDKDDDKVVLARLRRAKPFFVNSNLATATPKLTTNPKVIANIVAKSKALHLQKRVMRSVTDAGVTTPPTATINPCDLLCTKFEIDPICATNGLCLHEFPNQCILDTYNCKHPREKFSATRDDRCQMHWLEFCQESDLI